MSEIDNENIIVGLEVGTSKIVAVVGQVFADGNINIIGFSNMPSEGIDKGEITDLTAVSTIIQRVLDDAAIMANCDIEQVVLSVSGKHIQYRNESAFIAIGDNEEVTVEKVAEVMKNARTVKLGEGSIPLEVIPQEFSLDDRTNITDPIGLQGMRLTAQAHVIGYNNICLANLKKAVSNCKSQRGHISIKVSHIFYAGHASCEAVLTEDEKKLGVCVIDIGAGTTDVTLFTNNKVRLSQSFTFGGNDITLDLAHEFNVSFDEAEKNKIKYGSAVPQGKNEIITLKGAAPGTLIDCTLEHFTQITWYNYCKLLYQVRDEIKTVQKMLKAKHLDYSLGAGVVLTGAGANIPMLERCCSVIFRESFGENCPVRLGKPIHLSGLSDRGGTLSTATAVGLLRCYQQKSSYAPIEEDEEESFFQKLYVKSKKFMNYLRDEF